MMLDDRACLEALAAFGPRLRAPGASFGPVRYLRVSGCSVEPYEERYFEFTELGSDFIAMAYDAGWISTKFPWTTWNTTDEGERLLSNPKEIAAADVDQLMKLMTAIVRVDRFIEGALDGYCDNGTVLAIVERAEAMLQSGDSPTGMLKHYTWGTRGVPLASA